MGALLIENARIWDGSGAAPFPGSVLVEGNRIKAVAPAAGRVEANGAERLDAAGRFLMPGMVEGHAHPSFTDIARGTQLGELAPEDHALLTMAAARKLLDCGFTSLNGAASAKVRLDVAVREAIESGLMAGPRLLAAGPEITVTGGLGDASRMHLEQVSFGMIADGPDAVRKAARQCLREGVDTIKINISGDPGAPNAPAETTMMTDAEITAAVETAHGAGKRVAAHARAAESVKRAVRLGVDIIYHCDFADEEALDLLESAKDRIFTGPAIGIIVSRWEQLKGDNTPAGRAYFERVDAVLQASCRTHEAMRRRGIRVVIGGDYGFAVNRQGGNARDLEHFVRLFGFSASEALQAATRIGGEIMLKPGELGMIREGWLADLLLVDGDPLADVTVMQDRAKLAMIMKDGVRYA